MNQADWKYLRDNQRNLLDFTYYNKTRKIQKSLQYNDNPKAVVIHHLRDTEEQRKYNDEHYELWGHNLDGTFEYGKYVVFVTKEEHDSYHQSSDETRKKISNGVKRALDNGLREKRVKQMTGCGNPQYGKVGPASTCFGRRGELHPMYGKPSPFKGHHFSEESKKKLRESRQAGIKFRNDQYNKYLEIGGSLSKKSFLKILREYRKNSYWLQFSFDDFISQNKSILGLSE